MSDAQTEAVLTDGIPENLIDTMVQTALASGWRPTFEETNQFGRFIHVDAHTHFNPKR